MLAANQGNNPLKKSLPAVLRYGECDQLALSKLLGRYGLVIESVAPGDPVPGSFWGDEEAGLINNRLLVRADTPAHSILHEACHFICMNPNRRDPLHTDAGGDYDEENAVCYLQIVLAGFLQDMGRGRMFSDMDAWGYSFRLGSARAWYDSDAKDALQWLIDRDLLTIGGEPAWQLRTQET